MTAFLVTIGIIVGLALLGFASIGVWGCLTALTSRERRRAQLAHETRGAEAHIADIGRQAQEAIIAEALYRLRARHGERPW